LYHKTGSAVRDGCKENRRNYAYRRDLSSNTEKTAVSTRRPAFSAHFAPLMLLLYTGK
jgi:hypothetical protein